MKADLYTKVVLTVIALCLIIQVLNANLIPAAHAEGEERRPSLPKNVVLLPVNPDGSVNVVVKKMENPQDVVLVGWRSHPESIYIQEMNSNSYKQNYGLPVFNTERK